MQNIWSGFLSVCLSVFMGVSFFLVIRISYYYGKKWSIDEMYTVPYLTNLLNNVVYNPLKYKINK